jgi:glycosyltransferase involved in cell wall biosynthesis
MNIITKEPLVSVIVPTKNSSRTIEGCLESIKNQSYKNIEIIVVDNSSTDQTKKIVEKLQKTISNNHKLKIYLYNKGPERSAQRNYGAKLAKGEYLLFIDSDMILSKDVVKECVNKFKTENLKQKIGGIVIPEESFGESFWAECKALERSFYVGVDWIEAARFFPKKIFNEFSGYDEKQTGTEDFDLPQKIKSKYGAMAIGRIKSFIKHNEGKLSLRHTISKKFYYANTAKEYAKTNSEYFIKQANPLSRYLLFFANPAKLFKNPILGLGMLGMKTSEFVAGGFGYLLKK